MSAHVRANLWLLGLTLLLCSVVYPLLLWVIGMVAFPNQAEGSLIRDRDDNPVASRLIAHEVKGDEYFQPRPSAAGWNGAASGASNHGANNPLLRDRVAKALGPVVKYRNGKPVAPDVVKWFREERPGVVGEWAAAHPASAQAWVKSDDAVKDYVKDWFAVHPADLAAWQKENKDNTNPTPEDLAVAFFESFAREHPATWLTVAETREKDDKGNAVKKVELIKKDADDPADIAAVFFDSWRQAHPDAELEDVPADLVTASASGLDPHITLKNARYQLDRVAGKWAELTGQDAAELRVEIDALLTKHAGAPMFGLAGVEMVNVVEINLALKDEYGLKLVTPR